MPPPLPNQQNSRAGLISALVFFVILSLVAGFFAISSVQKITALEVSAAEMKKRMNDAVGDPSSAEYAAAQAAKEKYPNAAGVFEAEEMQRQELSRAMTGQPFPNDRALELAGSAKEQANKVLSTAGITPKDRGLELAPTESLIGAVVHYAQAYAKLDSEKKAAETNVDSLQKEKAGLIAQNQTGMTAKDEEIKTAQAAAQTATAQFDSYRKEQETSMAKVTDDTSKQIKALSDALAQQQTVVTQKDQEIRKVTSAYQQVLAQLGPFRNNAKENIVRQPDGILTRVTADGFCYINRGVNDHVTVGLTFEVYDKIKGIPALGDGMAEPDSAKGKGKTVEASAVTNAAAVKLGASTAALDTDLPKGKGSIEVVSVGPGHTSQCRVVHIEPAQTLTEGDVIGNLIYDPTRKYNFGLFGDFDLDGNGVPTTGDTAVIKRLIEQWGGKVLVITKPEEVGVNLDFVVMGVEPKTPPGLDANNPDDSNRIQQIKTSTDLYQSIRGRAAEVHVPIMNQNRFLYYIGYYDQKTR